MIERAVIRHDQMGTRRNFQSLGRDGDSLFSDLIDLFEKRFRVDDHAVAEYARLVLMDNSRRQQPQNKGLIADIHAMPGIMPALITRHDIKPVRQQINNLPFPFIAPLGTDYYNYHNVRTTCGSGWLIAKFCVQCQTKASYTPNSTTRYRRWF